MAVIVSIACQREEVKATTIQSSTGRKKIKSVAGCIFRNNICLFNIKKLFHIK